MPSGLTDGESRRDIRQIHTNDCSLFRRPLQQQRDALKGAHAWDDGATLDPIDSHRVDLELLREIRERQALFASIVRHCICEKHPIWAFYSGPVFPTNVS